MRWVVVAIALAGCDKFIALDYREPIDAPANGHDEDQDGIGDATDTCPGIANDQRKDADGDGVGDDCDLNPMADDDVAVFYAFDADTQPDWDRVQGSWIFTNDVLVYQAMQTGIDQLIARRGASKQVAPPYVIEARYKLDAIRNFSAFSVTANLDAAGMGAACSLERRADGVDVVRAYRPGTAGTNTTALPPLDISATFIARLIVELDTVRCDITSEPAGQGGSATIDMLVPALAPFGFEGRSLSATVDYVVVYTR